MNKLLVLYHIYIQVYSCKEMLYAKQSENADVLSP